MTSATTEAVVKMIGSLPEGTQEQVVEHLREYIADVVDEMNWDECFANSSNNLVSAAKKAKEEIARGLATPLDGDQL
jgi:hypothetical protein